MPDTPDATDARELDIPELCRDDIPPCRFCASACSSSRRQALSSCAHQSRQPIINAIVRGRVMTQYTQWKGVDEGYPPVSAFHSKSGMLKKALHSVRQLTAFSYVNRSITYSDKCSRQKYHGQHRHRLHRHAISLAGDGHLGALLGY